jgi:hypothetical protein
MRKLLLGCLAVAATASPALGQDAPAIDSVLVERTAVPTPRRIPLLKRRILNGPAARLAELSVKLQHAGFYRLAEASPGATLCGNTPSSYLFRITVFSQGGTRQLVVRDDCAPADADAAAPIRQLARDTFKASSRARH